MGLCRSQVRTPVIDRFAALTSIFELKGLLSSSLTLFGESERSPPEDGDLDHFMDY